MDLSAKGRNPDKQYSPNYGGARPGAGRPKGMVHREVFHFREKYEVMPLDYFMMVLNDMLPEKDEAGRVKKFEDGTVKMQRFSHADKMQAASQAAPFLHRRLANLEITGEGGGPVKHSIDLTKLTDAELADFERFLAKSQIVSLEPSEFSREDGETIEATATEDPQP